MRATKIVLEFGCFTFLIVSALSAPASAQSDVDIKKQIDELTVTRDLLLKRNALLLEIEALKKGQAAVGPVDAGSKTAANGVIPTPGRSPETTNAASDVPLIPIPGLKDLFVKKNSTVVNSVCQQQRLEPASYSIYDRTVCDIAGQLVTSGHDSNGKMIFDIGEVTNALALLIAGKLAELPPSEARIDQDVRDFILDAENKRNDKQAGSDAKSSGTTSLAVKGGVPAFLSWAVENGAAVGSRSGNTLTFRVNPVGILSRISDHPVLSGASFGDPGSYFKTDDSFTRMLSKFSLGFSFDITRGTDPPTFIGSKQQLSAFSARYNFINLKDPRHPRYREAWQALADKNLQPYTVFAGELHAKLVRSNDPAKYKNVDLERWRVETANLLRAVNFESKDDIELVEEARRILSDQLKKLPLNSLKSDTDVVAILNENGKRLNVYSRSKQELYDEIAKGEVLTFEYTNYREPLAPDVSNFRFIAEKGFGTDWNLTANASISFFNKRPAGVDIKRIRDFDFTLQLEKPFIELPFGTAILSFAGQYERIPSNIFVSDGLVKTGTQGDIATGQVKLVFPIYGTGIKLPISITFANRTELIKERSIRGNFGFTFDLDRLLFGRRLF